MHLLDGGESRLCQLNQTGQETDLVRWALDSVSLSPGNVLTNDLQGQQTFQEFPTGQADRLACCQTTLDDLIHSLALEVLIVPVVGEKDLDAVSGTEIVLKKKKNRNKQQNQLKS